VCFFAFSPRTFHHQYPTGHTTVTAGFNDDGIPWLVPYISETGGHRFQSGLFSLTLCLLGVFVTFIALGRHAVVVAGVARIAAAADVAAADIDADALSIAMALSPSAADDIDTRPAATTTALSTAAATDAPLIRPTVAASTSVAPVNIEKAKVQAILSDIKRKEKRSAKLIFVAVLGMLIVSAFPERATQRAGFYIHIVGALCLFVGGLWYEVKHTQISFLSHRAAVRVVRMRRKHRLLMAARCAPTASTASLMADAAAAAAAATSAETCTTTSVGDAPFGSADSAADAEAVSLDFEDENEDDDDNSIDIDACGRGDDCVIGVAPTVHVESLSMPRASDVVAAVLVEASGSGFFGGCQRNGRRRWQTRYLRLYCLTICAVAIFLMVLGGLISYLETSDLGNRDEDIRENPWRSVSAIAEYTLAICFAAYFKTFQSGLAEISCAFTPI
jgi:hypothetical protein